MPHYIESVDLILYTVANHNYMCTKMEEAVVPMSHITLKINIYISSSHNPNPPLPMRQPLCYC